MGTVRTVQVADRSAALPPSLSPTRAKDFASCGLRFYFGAVLGWRSPPTSHTFVGNVVHAAVEDLYRLPADERTRAAADEALGRRWTEAAEDGANEAVLSDTAAAEDLYKRATSMLDGLWQLENPQYLDVAPDNLERWVAASLFGAPIRGRIDRMTETPVWKVSDYKTGRRPAPMYVASALDALFTYAACLAAAHPARRIPDEIELLYLGSAERIVRPVLRPVLLAHARRQGDIWRRITACHASGEWEARTHTLCSWCPYRPVCPAHFKRAPEPGTTASNRRLETAGCVARTAATPVESHLVEPAEPDLVDPATLPEDSDA